MATGGKVRGPQGLANLVHERMGQLTAAERKVARVFLASYPIAGLENVAQLAHRANASGPTVMRFVGKLGFDGYPEFQEALRHEVQEKLTSSLAQYPEVEAQAGAGTIQTSLKVFHAELEKSFAGLPQVEFDAVVDLLADSRFSVLCTGGRFSQILAFYLFAHLNMMRSKCRYVVAAPTPRWDELIDVGRRTVIVVFDYRRYQNSTIEFAGRAEEKGCPIVLFTDPWLSPVAEVARHVLTSTVQGPSPFDTLVPALALIETVVAGLSVKLGAQAKPRIAELERLRAGTTWGEQGMEME
jgi:DNA-binding MurR/RpiR family transcriptional regulator